MGAWSRLTPRPSSNIRALVFFVFGDVTPSWSSFTRGSADRDLRLTAEPTSFCPEPGFGLGIWPGVGLEGSWLDGIFSLGLLVEDSGDDDGGLGGREELDLLDDSLEIGLGRSPELRLGLELLWWSAGGFVLGEGAEFDLGVDETLDFAPAGEAVIAGLDMDLLVVALTVLLFSLSLRWLL